MNRAVYLARWEDFDVAYSELTSPQYREDFQQGLKILQHFHGSQRIAQLIGFCDDILITEYYTLGESANFQNMVRASPEIDNISLRLQLCVDYVEILSDLHSSLDEVMYVMCDTNNLDKLLTQYLLSEDMHLVLNDVDSVAEVTFVGGEWRGIKCGKRELEGEFVAPEQKWTDATEFNDTEMQTYDEKTDIWKVPDVCNCFLGSGPEATRLQFKLLDIHMAFIGMIRLAQHYHWIIENGGFEPWKSEEEHSLAAPPIEQRIPTRHGLEGSSISLYLSMRKK
eukprot:XP_011449637.2 PREDICTED: protein O-mannose kinase [Crassostrea gigas]